MNCGSKSQKYDAVVIGAGVCGIYMLHRLLKLGLNATVFEMGDGPGGTWYWNRYPGARFDSESYSYGYSFSKEILQEWSWSEHFAAQPETLRYLNYVVDKLEVRNHMQFGCRVEKAEFDEIANQWVVTLGGGEQAVTRFLFTAIGMLSAATMPNIRGTESFKGASTHTYYWPKEGIELEGKRVAVIGTGATGVQVVGAIAGKVDELVVFQRRPNWCAPLHNSPIDDETQKKIKASYDQIFSRMEESPGNFLHKPDYRVMKDLPREERLKFWERLYASPGFAIWHGNFRDVLVNPEANAEFSEFMADKIRGRVNDPVVAEKLVPKDHGFGTRRVPLETRYYEAYNRENVRLIDIKESPIDRVTETGIETETERLDLDVIIYATGFDAITGAFDRIQFKGRKGRALRDKWHDDPITYLGLQVSDFPNLFLLAGPQGASVSSNFPPTIETAVNWTAGLIEFSLNNNVEVVEADPQAEQDWISHVKSGYEKSLLSTAQSWFTGYNSNVPGHDTLRHMLYLGGSVMYRDRLREVAENGYHGFIMR